MLSLSKCREILAPECNLSDEELELVRDQLYGIADIAKNAFAEQRRKNSSTNEGTASNHGFCEVLSIVSKHEREQLEERAGILEFDGGFQRSEAELIAMQESECEH